MTYPAGQARLEDSPILHAAIEIAPQICTAADQIEQQRRIHQPIVELLKAAGIFGMAMPKEWGGPELDPLTQCRVLEALAMADGSVGWSAMINCDSGYVSAFLDQDVARSMYADIQVGTAASAVPAGRAIVVSGGYVVSGRFPFVSGCHHCEWIWLGCNVIDNNTARIDANGVPITRQCFLKMSECEILDTWQTTGLRGTGSNDVLVKDMFVPDERTFSFQDEGLVKRRGPLHAFPFLFLGKTPSVALGIARHALNALIESAPERPARRYTSGNRLEPPKALSDEVFLQD